MYESTTLIKNMLKRMEENEVEYVIMRNFEFLFDSGKQVGNDLDVVIDKKNVRKVEQLFEKEFSGQQISPFSRHVGYWKYLPKEKKVVKFHFHIAGISGNHVIYLPSKQLLERKKKLGNFYVVSDEDLFTGLVLHAHLAGNKAKSKYLALVNGFIDSGELDRDYISSNLRRIYGDVLGKRIEELCFSKDFEGLENLRKKMRKKLISRNFFEIGLIKALSVVWKLYRRSRLKPLVVFLGMDGSGKTTATQSLQELLEKNKVKSCLFYTGRGKGNVLPIQFFGRKYKSREKKADAKKLGGEKKVSLSRRVLYSLAAPVFSFDLFLRYLFFIFPKRWAEHVVIADRYATDILLMKNVPLWVRKTLYFFFPKPVLVLYLYNEPKILYDRKPGHPKGDLERQEKIYSWLVPELKNVVSIKTESVDQTNETVGAAVFEKLKSFI